MSLATTCPQCKTSFKVVPDQLKLRRGLVRCGVCQNVFSGIDYLRYVEEPSRAAAPRGGAVGAADPDAASPESNGLHRTGLGDGMADGRGSGGLAADDDSTHRAGHASPAHSPDEQGPPRHRNFDSFQPARVAPGAGQPRGSGPQTIISADDELKTAFFLTDTGFGPDDGYEVMPPTSIRRPIEHAPADEPPESLPADAPDEDPNAPREHFLGDEATLAVRSGSTAGNTEPVFHDEPIDAADRDSGEEPIAAAERDFDDQPIAAADRALGDEPAAAADRAPNTPGAVHPAVRGAGGATTQHGHVDAEPPHREPARSAASTVQPERRIDPTAAPPGSAPDASAATSIWRDRSASTAPRLRARSRDDPRWTDAASMQRHVDGVRRERERDPFVFPSPAPAPAPAPAPHPDRRPPPPSSATIGDRVGGGHDRSYQDADAPDTHRTADTRQQAEFDELFNPGRRRGRRSGIAHSPAAWVVAGLLTLTLLVQLIVGWRDHLAARVPGAGIVLATALAPLGLSIAAPRDLSAMTIDSFELQSTGTPDRLQVSALLRNQARHPVRWPAMELTLTDSVGAVLVRKVIVPSDYLEARRLAAGGLTPNSEWALRLGLRHTGPTPTGYSVALFYL